MYKNELLNTSLYYSEGELSGNDGEIIENDNDVFLFEKYQKEDSTKTMLPSMKKFKRKEVKLEKPKKIWIINKEIQSNGSCNKNQTVFTKMSEDLYELMKRQTSNDKSAKFNYEDLISDNKLKAYSERFNPKNEEIIYNFIERSVSKSPTHRAENNDTIKTKNGNIPFRYNNHLVSTTPNHSTHPLIHSLSPLRPKKTKIPKHFYESQKQFLEKKSKNISKLVKESREIELSYMQKKPTMSPKSIELVNKKRKKDRIYDTDIHTRLFKDKNSQREMINRKFSSFSNYFISLSNDNKEVKTKKIKILPDKITNEFYNRLNNLSRSKSKSPDKDTTTTTSINSVSNNITSTTSTESNVIIFENFMNKYELMLINSHNKTLSANEDEVTIDKQQFLSSMISLGFVSYQPNKTEKNLLDDFFNLLLTLSTSPSLSTISSNNLLLFLLCVIGINPTEPKINSRLVSQIKCLDFSILTSNKKFFPKNINIKFHVFSDNYYNSIKAEKNIIRINKFVNSNKSEHSFSPKINKNSIKIYNEKWKHRFLSDGKKKITFIDVSKAYQAKKDNFIKKEKIEQLAKEMSNCTFKPDLSLTKRKNSENRKNNMNISMRLYINAKKKINQQNKIINESEKKKENESFSFKPVFTEYKDKMFKCNPLKNDVLVEKKIEKLKQKRNDDQKVKQFLEYGWMSKEGEMKLRDTIQKKELKGAFRLGSEKSKNKNINNENNEVKIISEMSFEVNIEMSNGEKVLTVHRGDDVTKKVNLFSEINNLTYESKLQIFEEILKNIKQKKDE